MGAQGSRENEFRVLATASSSLARREEGAYRGIQLTSNEASGDEGEPESEVILAWALTLRADDAAALGPLRLHSGVEACVAGEALWVRGRALDEALEGTLRSVPADGRYRVDESGRLRPWTGRLPVGVLPTGPWQSLVALLPLEPQAARLPADAGVPVTVRLVPADSTRDATLLLADAAAFAGWVLAAPQVRLACLSFARDDGGRVLVRADGGPLPPLPGRRLWEEGGIAAPCGSRWEPAVSAAVLAELFDLLPGELIVLEDAAYARLASSDFVPVTRASMQVRT